MDTALLTLHYLRGKGVSDTLLSQLSTELNLQPPRAWHGRPSSTRSFTIGHRVHRWTSECQSSFSFFPYPCSAYQGWLVQHPTLATNHLQAVLDSVAVEQEREVTGLGQQSLLPKERDRVARLLKHMEQLYPPRPSLCMVFFFILIWCFKAYIRSPFKFSSLFVD